MANAPTVRRFYRLLRRPVATLEDFTSGAALGRPAPADPYLASLHSGLSMYETEAQARATAAAYPRRRWRGVAAVDIPAGDARFRVVKSLGPGHFTIYGAAPDVLARVAEQGPL